MTAPAWVRPASVSDAVAAAGRPGAWYVAGGTEVANWLRDGLLPAPGRLVDLAAVPIAGVTHENGMIRIGAASRLADLAAAPLIRSSLPAFAEAIDSSASPAIRHMASVAGNLLQATRCPYFRGRAAACNRIRPGSGCGALGGDHRHGGLLGTDDRCVAVHPSDPAVALLGLDAEVLVAGAAGERRIALGSLWSPDSVAAPTLAPGELITAIEVPAGPLAETGRYRKVRDRASFEFALVAAAVHSRVEDGRFAAVSIALGGLAPRPWRCRTAEAALQGGAATAAAVRAAVAAELAGARPLSGNAFKAELAAGAVLRAFGTEVGA
ncbi:MAG: xanthine dehydrogenase family protein subunit M [Gemmatimonadales bacterium]